MEFEKPVIFFDGVCGLCNRFVDFVLERDDKNRFLFSPLQGKTAAKFLREPDGCFLGRAIVYADGENVHRASGAVIKILSEIGLPWSVAGVLIYVPRFIRDRVYCYVAANRYGWFGKADACRPPAPQYRNRFLP